MIFNHKARTAFAALALLGGTMAGGVAAAGPAAAAGSVCPTGPGASESWNFYDSSGHLAAVGYLYMDTNTSCVDLVAQGAYYGERKWMQADIRDINGTTYAHDDNYYYYYAGPATAEGYPLCPQPHFQMDDSSGNQILNYSPRIYCD